MKILIILLILFFSNYVFGEVYYCVEDAATGFDGGNNYKQENFSESKFTADIDFEKLSFTSEKIMIQTRLDGHICSKDFENELMQCINSWGFTFIINIKNLKFVHSAGLGHVLDEKNSDDLLISYGQCSLF
tara:strand:+ start:426 stop:818 length:393 start_codon:yes stop_codon:yes gene_type:complete